LYISFWYEQWVSYSKQSQSYDAYEEKRIRKGRKRRVKTLFKGVCFLAVVMMFVIGFNAHALLMTMSGLPEKQCDKIALIFSPSKAYAQNVGCVACPLCSNNAEKVAGEKYTCAKECLGQTQYSSWQWTPEEKACSAHISAACLRGCMIMIEKAKKLCGSN
jgi:hypothetical protein